ncbi:hypothetical protein evm_014860 [Chilo suppressalis]|nr:hypothetical protein evm_014860 [Chilo suppressalis]
MILSGCCGTGSLALVRVTFHGKEAVEKALKLDRELRINGFLLTVSKYRDDEEQKAHNASAKQRETNGKLTGNGATNESSGVPERATWGSPVEFILACLGYAVGLGNVWRFPYLCYRNGGGAFLIPFFLMLVFIGLPIFFLELYIGQYSGIGPLQAFSAISPFFSGLGYCTLVVISIISIYYMIIVAWILFYTIVSIAGNLDWGSCDNAFNSLRIRSIMKFDELAAFCSRYISMNLRERARLVSLLNWIRHLREVPSISQEIAVHSKLFSRNIEIFYSFGVACGSLITLASYNKFNNNCHFDAVMVCITNFLTSIYAGFAIFAVLGFQAQQMGVSVDGKEAVLPHIYYSFN